MDPQSFQVLTILFGLCTAAIGALVMLWIKALQAALKENKDEAAELRRQLTDLALDVARNYMPRDELEKKLDSIFALLTEIQKEVRHQP